MKIRIDLDPETMAFKHGNKYEYIPLGAEDFLRNRLNSPRRIRVETRPFEGALKLVRFHKSNQWRLTADSGAFMLCATGVKRFLRLSRLVSTLYIKVIE